MKRRGVLLVAGVVGLAFGVLGVGWWLSNPLPAPPHRITKAGYDALEIGMEEAAVVAVVGVPAGDYSTKPGMLVNSPKEVYAEGTRSTDGTKWWADFYCRIRVDFDDQGVVTGKGFTPLAVPRDRWFDKVYDWLDL